MILGVNILPTEEEKRSFLVKIEEIVLDKNITYMDAVLLHCKTVDLEESVAASLIHPVLKIKIENEARNLNMLKVKRRNTLPI